MAPVGVQRLCLKNLHTKITNSLIVGVIIAKQPCKIFADKKNGGDRGVWNFTLRDSPTDYINCTCWGRAEYALYLDQTFCVGDVVDVIDPRIEIRHIDDNKEQFRPAVTSPFNLTLNENMSHIIIHAGDNYQDYIRFLRIPTKPIAGCLTLADVRNNGMAIRGDMVDLLVIVKYVRPVRKILVKKDGKEKDITDVTVIDRTGAEMSITLWDQDMVQRARNWKRYQTILFLADVRVEWSQFQNQTVIGITSRTIITEDPIVPAADELREYAKKAPVTVTAYLDQLADKIPDPKTIKSKIMTCQHVLDKAETATDPSPDDQYFTAVLYAFVMQLDLDGYTKITSTRCGRCSSYILSENKKCNNSECSVATGAEPPTFETFFDVRIILADHTGSLENCRISGRTAEKVLGVTIDQFEMMTFEQKEDLKWKYLLERCAVHVVAFKNKKGFEPFVSILSWRLADSEEIFNNLPFY